MKAISYRLPPLPIPLLFMPLLILIGMSFSASASVNLAPPSLDDPYYLGQLTYHKKLACGTCPLSKTTLDAAAAKNFVQSLETDKQFTELLTNKERSAVAFYVKEFFAPRR